MCVEVDLSIPIALGVNVGKEDDTKSFFQPFVYKKLLQICYRPGRIGHRLVNCEQWKKKFMEKDAKSNMLVYPTGVDESNESFKSEDCDDPIYGSWIQVSRRMIPINRLRNYKHKKDEGWNNRQQNSSEDHNGVGDTRYSVWVQWYGARWQGK